MDRGTFFKMLNFYILFFGFASEFVPIWKACFVLETYHLLKAFIIEEEIVENDENLKSEDSEENGLNDEYDSEDSFIASDDEDDDYEQNLSDDDEEEISKNVSHFDGSHLLRTKAQPVVQSLSFMKNSFLFLIVWSSGTIAHSIRIRFFTAAK